MSRTNLIPGVTAMSERKALLILHGKQALNEAVRAAVENKREQGWELAVRLTWEAGDAQRLVAVSYTHLTLPTTPYV